MGYQETGAFAFRATTGSSEQRYLGSLPIATANPHEEWERLFDASLSNSTYGASSTVQPAAGAVQYLIKY